MIINERDLGAGHGLKKTQCMTMIVDVLPFMRMVGESRGPRLCASHKARGDVEADASKEIDRSFLRAFH